MAVTINGQPEATGADTAINLGLQCPRCGEDTRELTIDLNALGGIYCPECDSYFDAIATAETLAVQAAKWKAVARWIGQAEAWVGAAGGEGEAQS